eukprot:1008421-Prymnesium_polylepis.1
MSPPTELQLKNIMHYRLSVARIVPAWGNPGFIIKAVRRKGYGLYGVQVPYTALWPRLPSVPPMLSHVTAS